MRRGPNRTALAFTIAGVLAVLARGLTGGSGLVQPSIASSAEIGPLPPVPIPVQNPMTPEKVSLGKMLFFDYRLSADGSRSCVHCHQPDQGWAFKDRQSPADPSFDRYASGDLTALSTSARRGLELFKGKARCILCHNGPALTDNGFHNLGVPEAEFLKDPRVLASLRFDAKRMGEPEYRALTADPGRYLVTKQDKDFGSFKTPTLRNVASRTPYMHNGAFDTLAEVIAFYNKGGGNDPRKDPNLQRLGMN